MKLLIGYGNTLRSDDGVGWVIANRLAQQDWQSSVRIVAAHQLLPEMAADITDAERVVFVDASIDGQPGAVRVRGITAPNSFEEPHALTPLGLLAFCEQLYTPPPPAYLMTVTGVNFALGETLSPAVEAAIPEALALAAQLLAVSSQGNRIKIGKEG